MATPQSSWRRPLGAALLLIAIGLWVPASDVVKLIAEQDDVLLGRYDENRVYLGLLLSPLLIVTGLILMSRVALNRVLAFKVMAVALSAVVAYAAVDIGQRFRRKPRYEAKAVAKLKSWPHKWRKAGDVKTRPPNAAYNVKFDDSPSTDRSYPGAPSGFPPVQVRLTVDDRGFRNEAALDQADIVILGDSFAEGSRVDDSEVWGRIIGERLGRSTYNLAISGGSPRTYMNHFVAFGAELRPKLAVCLIYEGNDLKVHSSEEEEEAPEVKSFYYRARDTIKDSPVIGALRDVIDDSFGAMRADSAVPGWEALSWMPLRIQHPNGDHYVAFEPKRLARLYYTVDKFRAYKGWKRARAVFQELKQACDEAGAGLVFVYAPSSPHVLLPLAADTIPGEGLRQFLGYEKDGLPPADELMSAVLARLDSCETVFSEFAADIGAPVIHTTTALRERAASGQQVYYTYDQHWTRHGHEVVADVVERYLSEHPELLGHS